MKIHELITGSISTNMHLWKQCHIRHDVPGAVLTMLAPVDNPLPTWRLVGHYRRPAEGLLEKTCSHLQLCNFRNSARESQQWFSKCLIYWQLPGLLLYNTSTEDAIGPSVDYHLFHFNYHFKYSQKTTVKKIVIMTFNKDFIFHLISHKILYLSMRGWDKREQMGHSA